MITERPGVPALTVALPGRWLRVDDAAELEERGPEVDAVRAVARALPQAHAVGVQRVFVRIDPGRPTAMVVAWPAERVTDLESLFAQLPPEQRAVAEPMTHREGLIVVRVPTAGGDGDRDGGVVGCWYWVAEPLTGRLLSLVVQRLDGVLGESEVGVYDAIATNLLWEEPDA